MNKRAQTQYDKLEEQRNTLLAPLRSVSNQTLLTPPAPGKWSALQILSHVYTSEKMSLQYIKKKSQGISSAGTAGVKQAVLMVVLTISQRIPMRYRAPKMVVESTPAFQSLAELEAAWSLLRLEMKSMLENLPDSHLRKLVYKHPVAGRLSFLQAMVFFGEHMRHHAPQLKRSIKA
jgi:DinB superfamily